MKKLDVLSNDLFINTLKSSYAVAAMVSEENETIIEVETERAGQVKLPIINFITVFLMSITGSITIFSSKIVFLLLCSILSHSIRWTVPVTSIVWFLLDPFSESS